jgi:hypothetical protein
MHSQVSKRFFGQSLGLMKKATGLRVFGAGFSKKTA